LTELPPGPSEIVCELQVHQAGEFSSQLHLFVDDQGTREIVFTVRGKATAATTTANQYP